jgi:hypothetical protein
MHKAGKHITFTKLTSERQETGETSFIGPRECCRDHTPFPEGLVLGDNPLRVRHGG